MFLLIKKQVNISRLYMQIVHTRIKWKNICSKSKVKCLWFDFSPWTSQPHRFEEYFNMILSFPKPNQMLHMTVSGVDCGLCLELIPGHMIIYVVSTRYLLSRFLNGSYGKMISYNNNDHI
jgi:hypothetical protein